MMRETVPVCADDDSFIRKIGFHSTFKVENNE